MDLFSSSTLAGRRRTVLLAPSEVARARNFPLVRREVSEDEHGRLLAKAQRLRGRIYLADGAITEGQLSDTGRHIQQADFRSFHVLSVDADDEVVACARCRWHSSAEDFENLGVSSAPLAKDPGVRPKLRHAVNSELDRAKKLNFGYVELGGWAIHEDLRCSTEAIRMVVTFYALGRLMGGALGISTVTRRHASSSILRRVGGEPLVVNGDEVGPYYDPNYACEMEILRFDSNRPSNTYEIPIQRCQKVLARTPVIVPEEMGLHFPMLAPFALATA